MAEFDPEGEGYDDATAAELIEMFPLTLPKPYREPYPGEKRVMNQPEAFQAWVWHDEDEPLRPKGWYLHSSSRDPRTGMLLKGRKHKTYHLTQKGEEEAGMEIYKKNGRYYSRPKRK